MDKEQLLEALKKEITSDPPDMERVAELSTILTRANPDVARFSVDAGMIARLGRELVQRHDTALSELVKNGYDADATSVDVHIARQGYGEFIEIRDDGSGMSRDELAYGFMRLATTSKINEPRSPRFSRRRAGKKGVGRFAAERLGHRLILTTATSGSDLALQIDIDWDRFISGKDLSTISVPIVQVPKAFSEGTLLRIERLRDSWPTSAVEKTFRQIVHLIDPGDQTTKSAVGSEFSVTFRIDGRSTSVVDVSSEVASYAFAVIDGEIDAQGRITYGLRCSRLGLFFSNRRLRLEEATEGCVEHARNVRLRAYYFILDRANIPPTAYNTVTTFLGQHGGIRVYRNGFRVPPYGQAGDDWLELDQLSSRRTLVLAPIRNRNFLGSVSITDEESLFEETSSREGLIQSDALSELTAAFQAVLLTATREIDAERARRNLKRERPVYEVPAQQVLQAEEKTGTEIAVELKSGLAEARRAVELAGEHKTADGGKSAITEALDRLELSAADASSKAAERDALVKEIDLLRVLASMGLAVGQFTHEFSTLSGAMRADLAILLESGRTDAERSQAAVSLRALLDQARAFSGLFKSMTEENALRERQRVDLYEAITSFKAALRSILVRNGVDFEVDDGGQEVLTPPMHRSELFGVLLNLTTNSVKAIKRARRKGKILVRLGTDEGGSAIVEFLDNGDGVAHEVRQTLFDAFVTTTASTGKDLADEELSLGSGLGLTIVRDIVTATGGSVALAEADGDFSTCFRVVLPNRGAET